MGSYLSIHNTTNDTYSVKVGIDEAAVRVLTIVGIILASLSAILVTAGAAAPGFSVVAMASGAAKVLGITAAHLVALTSIASTIAGITIAADLAGLAISFSIFIAQELEDQGFVTIKPNAKHSFGKYSLSLWRQGTCHRARPDPNNPNQVLMDTVYMRPIFSGATANSTLEHNIQYWVNKWGHENHTVVELSADNVDTSRSAIDKAIAQFEDVDWKKVIEETRRKAKQEMLEKEGLDQQEQYA